MPSKPHSVRWDRALGVLAALAASLLASLFGLLLWEIVRSGSRHISWAYLTTEPLDSGRAGGIVTVLVSTLLVLAVSLTVALPLGIATAAWLAEYTSRQGRVARYIRASLDLLASIPSIVYGLFGMVFFCQFLGMGYSILAGGLTLACMILPIVVQTTHAGFRSAPDELRFAAAALGFRRVSTLWYLLLPAALHGVVVGVILGLGRAMAETAALIFTSGYSARMPESLFDSGRTLSVHIFDLSMNLAGGRPMASAAALVLLACLLVLNVGAQSLARLWLRGGT